MNIRILTIHDIGNNYGSAIQSCALLSYLNGLGHDAKIVNYTPDYASVSVCLRRALAETLYRKDVKKRRASFSRYYQNCARLTERIGSIEKLGPQPEDTVWMIGSDQVWNPHFPCGNDGAYTLSFTESKRKTAYAASAGCVLTDEECAALAEKIGSFSAVSFREAFTAEQMKPYLPSAKAVLDPVFLKTREQYLSETGARLIEGSYLLIYAINGDPLMDRAIAAYKAAHPGTKTVLVGGLKKKAEADLFLRDIGPGEFLTLLRDAEHVLVSSFHGLALSVILEKEVSVVEPALSKLRLRDFAERAGLTDRFLTETDLSALDRPVDHKKVAALLGPEIADSKRFLESALDKAGTIGDKISGEEFDDAKQNTIACAEHCCGCGVCLSVCPVGCISWKTDEKGESFAFADPAVCIGCGKCKMVCPMIRVSGQNESSVYRMLSIKNKAVRNSSTSGGAFTAIVEALKKDGCTVYGAAYGERGKIVHKRIENLDGLSTFRKAKYGPSSISEEIYEQIGADIRSGKQVIFSGLPCQCAAVQNRYPDADGLWTIELICHGVPDPAVYDAYLNSLEKRVGGKIVSIDFRDKARGWETPLLTVCFSNGKRYRRLAYTGDDPYMQAFLSGKDLKEACYRCPYASNARKADFTIGDCWGGDQMETAFASDRDEGISLLVMNTQRAKDVESAISNVASIAPIEETQAKAVNRQLVEPSARSIDTDTFKKTVLLEGWEKAETLLHKRPPVIRLADRMLTAKQKRFIKRMIRRR